MILAKSLYLFYKNGIFSIKDNRRLPIQKVLQIWILKFHWTKFPMFILEETKTINWYFRPLLLSLVIFMGMLSELFF